MHSSNEVTQRCPQRDASPTSKYQFCARPEDDATHIVIEGEPAVKLHTKNVKLGLPEIETPDKTKLSGGTGTVCTGTCMYCM